MFDSLNQLDFPDKIVAAAYEDSVNGMSLADCHQVLETSETVKNDFFIPEKLFQVEVKIHTALLDCKVIK